MTSLLAWLDKTPPYLCRLLARKGHGQQRMTIREIAAASGLSKSQVARLAIRRTWKDIPVDEADAFARGCGVDFFHLKAHRYFMTSRKWSAWMRDGRSHRYYSRLMGVVTH